MTNTDTRVKTATIVLSCVFAALTCALSIVRFLDADEIEHVHSTWYVLNGQLPYVDFFQHHHALLWYCLAPVLALTGQSANALIVFRLVFLALTFAIVRATYLLALECGGSRDVARLTVLLLLSMTTFVYVAIEIRPDVPQTLFAVVSSLYLVRLFRTHAPRHAAYSGAAVALSFLFLQKAVFFLAAYSVLFLFQVVRRHLPWRTGLWFMGAFTLTCAPYSAYLAATGSLDDYVIADWWVNANVRGGRAVVSFLNPWLVRDFARNAVFWVIVAGATATLFRRRFSVGYAVPACLGLGLLALLFAVNRVADRYVVVTVPFLSVAAAAWLGDQQERFRLDGRRAIAVLVLIATIPGVAMVRSLGRSNTGQLLQIQYVLDHSRVGEGVYDYDRIVNVFRPDVHYFWFHVGGGARRYNNATSGRYADYNACRLIESMKPRFVSQRRAELETCGLMSQYTPTGFDRLFVRVGQ